MKEKYTFEDIIEARDAERERCRIIIEYLLNKNSKTLKGGGVNLEGFFEDMQDFETSLIE